MKPVLKWFYYDLYIVIYIVIAIGCMYITIWILGHIAHPYPGVHFSQTKDLFHCFDYLLFYLRYH